MIDGKEGGYQPSEEEIKTAEEHMTEREVAMSEGREEGRKFADVKYPEIELRKKVEREKQEQEKLEQERIRKKLGNIFQLKTDRKINLSFQHPWEPSLLEYAIKVSEQSLEDEFGLEWRDKIKKVVIKVYEEWDRDAVYYYRYEPVATLKDGSLKKLSPRRFDSFECYPPRRRR